MEKWQEIEVVALDGKEFSSDSVREQAGRRYSSGNFATRFLEYLDQEATTSGAKREAIEVFAPRAAEESREFDWASPLKIEVVEEGMELFETGTEPATAAPRPTTLAWHDRTAVMVQLSFEQVVLEYIPSLRDEQRVARLQHRYGTKEHRLETADLLTVGAKMCWRRHRGGLAAMKDNHYAEMNELLIGKQVSWCIR